MRTLALALAALCVLACDRFQTREELYPNGARKLRESFVLRNGYPLRQGLRATWYPDGSWESLEAYVDGRRKGYAYRWHPNGRLMSLVHFADGEPDGKAKYWDEDGALVACTDPETADCLPESRMGGRP